ncbi:unnamed protein product [Callosobruchus maculatus]|uniref:Uncharacterized protein n=1 Tax=Callosobruchus maculatus TaxID=64391 RepID=A0A653C3X6_CALMS|nr:unnamed protein product [Callosobruchus maculatus]
MYQLMCYAERVFPRPTMSLHIGGSERRHDVAGASLCCGYQDHYLCIFSSTSIYWLNRVET